MNLNNNKIIIFTGVIPSDVISYHKSIYSELIKSNNSYFNLVLNSWWPENHPSKFNNFTSNPNHPSKHAAIIEYDLENLKENQYYLISTFSQYVIYYFRMLVLEEKLLSNNIKINFITGADGDICQEILFSKTGELSSYPNDFMHQDEKDSYQIVILKQLYEKKQRNIYGS